MKTIKYIISFLAIITLSFQMNAQGTFDGTWEWENGNQIFRVEIWTNEYGGYYGKYQMVEVNNNEETIIYTSDKPVNSNSEIHWPDFMVFRGGGNGVDWLYATITDVSMDYEDPIYDEYDLWPAGLDMYIVDTCSSCPVQATWKVQYKDLTPENAMPLQIPTDVVMTKVE